MGYPIVINVDALSITNPLSQVFGGTGLPDFVLGDDREIDLYLVDASGVYTSASGDSSLTVELALVAVAEEPTSGTYTLSYDGDTTSALAYDASAADVETALNALASITYAGGVSLIGNDGGPFMVTFNSNGLRTAITGSSVDLNPASAVFTMNTEPGDGFTPSKQGIRIRQNVVAYQDTWAVITESGADVGWRANFATDSLEALLALGGARSVTLQLELQITTTAGKRSTFMQSDVLLLNDGIDVSTLAPLQLPTFLSSANNLSELSDVAAARNNLNLRSSYGNDSAHEAIGGAYFDGIEYVATNTSATRFIVNDAGWGFYRKTGLTIGNTFASWVFRNRGCALSFKQINGSRQRWYQLFDNRRGRHSFQFVTRYFH